MLVFLLLAVFFGGKFSGHIPCITTAAMSKGTGLTVTGIFFYFIAGVFFLARGGHSSRDLLDCSFLKSSLNFDSVEISGDLKEDFPDTRERIIVCGCPMSGESAGIEKGSCKGVRDVTRLLDVSCVEEEVGWESDCLYPLSTGEGSVDFINTEGEKNALSVLENLLRFTIFHFEGLGDVVIRAERLSEEDGGGLIVDSHGKEDGDVREYLLNFLKSYGVTVRFFCVEF